LTAHAIRALSRTNEVGPSASGRRWVLGEWYLRRHQRRDGSWLPLWFGNQHAPDDENPTYGTARVLAAYRDLDMMDTEPARRGVAWLLAAQNADGGWGGASGVVSSIEETALAVEVLLDAPRSAEVQTAVNNGLAWLVEQVEAGGLKTATPIGFYFAKLWYFEKLYPIIFTVAALGRARRKLSAAAPKSQSNPRRTDPP
jgi:squalene-hopene/tetraprenyl-beta-curcumene cyclase